MSQAVLHFPILFVKLSSMARLAFFHVVTCKHIEKVFDFKTAVPFSISKSKLHFEIEIPFRNRSSISKSKLHFQIEASFPNRSSILKSKLHLEIEGRFWNRISIFKSKLHFKSKAWFRNRRSFSKSKLDFKIETPFRNRSSISKWKPQKCSFYFSYISVMAQMEHRT